MARILARFNDDLVAAAVRVGKFDARSSHVLTRILIARRDKILKRYLTRLSPIGNLASRGDALCGTDLARAARIVPANARPIAGRVYRGRDLEREGAADVDAHEDGTFCVKLDHESPEWRPGESVDARYVVVELTNGHARGPLRAHLYDLGPSQGFRLVGVERPEKMGESLPD
jgi:hypothetical protein